MKREGKAVVMSSGGMDSTSLLALALTECESVMTVSFNYGSLHNLVENVAARQIALFYGLENTLISLPRVFSGAHSSLMGDSDTPMPHVTYEEILNGQGPSPTVVPNRNMSLIAFATTIAIVNNAQWVYFGPHATDSGHFAYPDCAGPFVGAMQAAVHAGSYGAVQLRVPFQWITKEEVCSVGLRLKAPLHLTWTCYDPVPWRAETTTGHYACGECPSCIERIESFRANGVIDPVTYAKPIDWGKCLPFDEPTFEYS